MLFRLSIFELWKNGQKSLWPQWVAKEGDTFLVSNKNEDGEEDNVTYLYPDLMHVLKGTFKDSKMQRGRFGVISGIDWNEDGIPDLQVVNL